MPAPAATVHVLLERLVDYAGLFPPAGLSMDDAVAAYARQLASPDRWMLGRFVVPATRLAELAASRARVAAAGAPPWQVAALGGADLASDVALVHELNVAEAGRMVVDVMEAKAATPTAIAACARAVGDGITLYAEVPVADDPRPLVVAARAVNVRVKVRTGGVVPGAFPTAAQLARLIACCAAEGVPFKATAGLHHPVRAEHRLTYEPDAPRGVMFGFLNVFCAGALAIAGAGEAVLAQALEERDAGAFRFGDDALRWRDLLVTRERLLETRQSFAISFGSCSFTEPVTDLHHLGLL